MMVTRETDYAIRAILFLATRPEGTRVSARELARDRVIPKALTRRILTRLVKAGLLKSLRGLKGGVSLAKPPSQINVLEVMEAIGKVPRVSPCVDNPQVCPFSENCPVREMWVEIDGEIKERLRKTTFEELVRRMSATEAAKP